MILFNAETRIVRCAIQTNYRELRALRDRKGMIMDQLAAETSPAIFISLIGRIKDFAGFCVHREGHHLRKKFMWLEKKQKPKDSLTPSNRLLPPQKRQKSLEEPKPLVKKIVHNLSDRPLSRDEQFVLEKGLKFSTYTGKPYAEDLKVNIENFGRKLINTTNGIESSSIRTIRPLVTDSQKNDLLENKFRFTKKSSFFPTGPSPPNVDAVLKSFGNAVSRIVDKNKPKRNLNGKEMLALKKLTRDENIKIVPADKGNAVVILSKGDYEKKTMDILNDPVHFKMIHKNPTAARAKKLSTYLRGKFLPAVRDEALFRYLNPSGDMRTPQLYILIKIHKPEKDFPGRPIVSAYGSYNYNLGKYLVWALEPYLSSHDSYVRDAGDFVEKLTHRDWTECKQVSFDVTSLYTMVPVQESINVAMSHISDDNDNRFRPLTLDIVAQLFKFCTSECNFQFHGKNYDQIEGLSMGNPLAPPLSNLFMISIEAKALKVGLFSPLLWLRYVDDVYCLMTEDEFENLDAITDHLNSVHSSINFTTETEKPDGSFNFLNVNITRIPYGRFATSVYRKPTNTNLYTRWDSAHPPQQKMGIFHTLLHQAKLLCSSPSLLKEETNFLLRVFIENGYPENQLKNALSKFYLNKGRKNQRSVENECNVTLSIPFIPGISEKVAREWKKFSKLLDTEVPTRVVFKPVNKLRASLCRLYDREPAGRGIYQANCASCESAYIGETGNFLSTRIKQHSYGGAIRDHAKASGHNFNDFEWKMIKHQTDPNLRRIYEARYIKAEKTKINLLNASDGVQALVFP